MSNVLEQLKLRRRHEVVLRSGLKIGYHFPDIQECIIAGQIPLPALRNGEQLTEEEATAQLTADPDAVKRGWEFKQRLVASMIEAIDGEDITDDDDRSAIVSALEPEERDELYILATERGGSGEA